MTKYEYTTPEMQRVERKITETFRKRDALMDEATRTGRWARVNALEAVASLQQTILAGLVEPFDAARAKRLRDMADSRKAVA